MNILSVENVKKNYAEHTALSGVSIEVPEHSIFGLLGPNGAGKTTLIRIINQITAPDSGQVLFKGQPLKRTDIHKIGYLPEERGLYKKMKVGEQAIYLARLKGLSRRDALKRLKFWFDKFEIYPWWDKKVEELSKGMQQKVQFICTVLHEPELLIFDEPFSGFDPINAQLIRNEILELKKKGAAIIFSTHQMASVEELCDHIALINKSRKILDGSTYDVKQAFRTNEYELIIEGELSIIKSCLEQNFVLLNSETNKNNHHLHIKSIHEDALDGVGHLLLKTVMPLGEVHRFQERIPTMNDIFIKSVETNKELVL